MQSSLDRPCHKGRAVVFALTLAVVLAGIVPVASARPRDRDNDGLRNRFELRVSKTNPKRKDTDSDGLKDGREVRRLKTNPRRKDTDSDGLKDRRELRLKTNPRRKDTDRDGLKDRRELRLKTNPRRKDTDRDGLSDGEEVRRYKTNPRRRDTDGDGVPDGKEVAAGSDPRDPSSRPSIRLQPRAEPPFRCDSTVTTPAQLMAAARSSANEGRVVCARAGDYGSLRFEGISHPVKVTIAAQPGEQAIIRYTVIRNVQGLRIQGFRMPSGGFDLQPSNNQRIEIADNEIGGGTFGGVIVWYGARDILIEDNHFHDLLVGGSFADGYGVSSRGGNSRVENLRIRYNTFERTQNDALEIGSTYGGEIVGNRVSVPDEVNHSDPLMYWSGSSGFLIKDNVFSLNWNASLFFGGDNRDTQVINNLVVGNRNWCATAGASGSSSGGIHNTVYRNNTFFRCGQAWTSSPWGRYGLALAGSSSGVVIEHNILSSVERTTPPAPASAIVAQSGNVIGGGIRAAGDISLTPRFDGRWVPTNLPASHAYAGYRPAPVGHTP
jgi:hypothetical protein